MASTAELTNTIAESVIAIWLDAEVNIKEENREAQKKLRTIISRLKTFESRNECEKYIRSISSAERLLLIVSGRFGRELVPDIHSLSQVTSIYVYCRDKKANEQWSNHFTKVVAVTIQLEDLIALIKIDQESLLLSKSMQTLSFSSISNTTVSSTVKSTVPLVFSSWLCNVLLRLKPSEKDKTGFFSLCKDIYKDSKIILNDIHVFQQNYTSNKALWWYTYGSFIYEMLNEALSTQDINKIFLFQFFICDMHRQLTENQCRRPIKVYRGTYMSDQERNRLKESVGGFMSKHTFLSTITNRSQVVHYLNARSISNNFHRVLFEIDADPQVVRTKPFADIKEHSYLPDKSAILFSIGSFFRITSIQQNEDQIWCIQMTLCGDDDPKLQVFLNKTENKYGYCDEDADFFSFCRMLRAMEKFDEAGKYCRRLLQHFSSNESLLSIVYDELAEIAVIKRDYDLRDQWHQKSIEIKKKIESASVDNSAVASDNKDDHDPSHVPIINDPTPEDMVSPTITSTHDEAKDSLRFTDVEPEKHDILLPIEGHEKMPLVSLEEAVVPLIPILPDIRRKVHTAKLKCTNPADSLTPDQSAAIMLYTMGWEPRDECLYVVLNAHLRAADRDKLKPWFLYLKLILTGLSRLPSIQRTVYRGVKLDLSSEHREGKQFFWWGFSSCTREIKVMQSKKFLGDSGARTLFHIECMNGKDIRHHSYYQKEDEVLLLPATYFEVKSCFEMAPDLHVIQIKEIKPEFPYLEPVV